MKPPRTNWSEYQQAIFKEVQETTRNIAVEACAGSGKSTTLRGVIQYLPTNKKIKVIAFNKAIADELSKDLPNRISVSTAHAYGYYLCMRATKSFDGGLTIDNLKYHKLAEQAVQRLMTESYMGDGGVYPNFRNDKVVTQLKKSVVEVCRYFRTTLPDFSYEGVQRMLEEYSIIVPHQIKHYATRLALDCIIRGNQQFNDHKALDLTDLLYIPHNFKLKIPNFYDFTLVDEAQDASNAMLSLYRKFHEKGSRMILLGDTAQSIFKFAGATSNAFPTLKRIFKCVEFPLPVTYRCPKSHVALANQIVPNIIAPKTAKTGTIATKTRQQLIDEVKPGDVVLSRFSAPLVELCLQLTFEGTKVTLRGTDVGEGLANKAKAICGNNPLATFTQLLHDWVQYSLEQIDEDEDTFVITEIENTANALSACYKAFGNICNNSEEFCDKIKNLFASPTDESIVLSTIHSFKGGESARVWLLNSEELPIDRETDEETVQELNLLYVALTRSTKDLFFVPSIPMDSEVGGIALLNPVDMASFPSEEDTNTITQQLSIF